MAVKFDKREDEIFDIIKTSIKIKDSYEDYKELRKRTFKKMRYDDLLPISNEDVKEVSRYVKELGVNVVGSRIGDTLIGIHNITKDAVIKIIDKDVPPHKKDLDMIRSIPEEWNRFLHKLDSIQFYKMLSIPEREYYLKNNEVDKDLHVSDIKNITIQIVDSGNSNITKLYETLSEDVVESLSLPIRAKDLEDMFPKKVGSNARHHTLIFITRLWRIYSMQDLITININKGVSNVPFFVSGGDVIVGNNITKDDEMMYDGKNAYIIPVINFYQEPENIYVIKDDDVVDKKRLKDTLIDYTIRHFIKEYNTKKFVSNSIKRDVEVTLKMLGTFTCAMLKSLLQKLIRFSPVYMSIPTISDTNIYSEIIMWCCCITLMFHHGSFVPDIQRYVGGLESFCKRLLISGIEDSYIKDQRLALKLMVGAFVAQRVKGWFPNELDIKRYLHLSSELMINPSQFDYTYKSVDIKESNIDEVLSVNEESLRFRTLVYLLRNVKSFASDINMVECCEEWKQKISTLPRPYVVSISHCIDQHCDPNLFYLMDYKVIKTLKVDNFSTPFGGVANKTFKFVTGINHRFDKNKVRWYKILDVDGKDYLFYDEDSPNYKFIDCVKNAQQRYFNDWIIQRISFTPSEDVIKKIDKGRVVTDEQIIIDIDIDKEWVSGMLGPIEIKIGANNVLVLLKPNVDFNNVNFDPIDGDFVMVKKPPSRGVIKDPTISNDIKQKVIKALKERIKYDSTGLVMNACDPPSYLFKNIKIRLGKNEDSLQFKLDTFKFFRDWNQINSIRKLVDVIEDDDKKIVDIIINDENNDRYITYYIDDNTHFSLKKGMMKDVDITDIIDYIDDDVKDLVLKRFLMYIGGNRTTIQLPKLSRDGGYTKEACLFEDVCVYRLLKILCSMAPAAITIQPKNVGTFIVRDTLLLKHIHSSIEYRSFSSKKISVKEWGNIQDQKKREVYAYQKNVVDNMNVDVKGHFMWMKVGSGKTLTVMYYLKKMIRLKVLPRYIIYTLPSSAITSIISEIEAFGFKINYLYPILKKKYNNDKYTVEKNKFLPYHINLIEHDHLKRLENEAISISNECILIVDEVHKTLADTKRTSTCITLSRLCQQFIVFTGTPVIDGNSYKLLPWLEQTVQFNVNERNFWVAANNMISRNISTGIEIDNKIVEVDIPDNRSDTYYNLLPSSLGGKNANPSFKDLNLIFEICYEECNKEMVKLTLKTLKDGERVFLVAKDKKNAEILKNNLIKKGVREQDIFVIDKDNTIHLTDENVKDKKVKNYKVVIAPIKKAEGYTLVTLGVMIRSVYFTNNAIREQIEGRLNRTGQRRKKLTYYTITCGILTYVLERHNKAKNLSMVLNELTNKI
jgi:hypothetical protein